MSSLTYPIQPLVTTVFDTTALLPITATQGTVYAPMTLVFVTSQDSTTPQPQIVTTVYDYGGQSLIGTALLGTLAGNQGTNISHALFPSILYRMAAVPPITNGGSGYAVNDTITVGGFQRGQQHKLTVTSTNAGVVTGLAFATRDQDIMTSTNPTTLTVSGGTGSGLTLGTPTYSKCVGLVVKVNAQMLVLVGIYADPSTGQLTLATTDLVATATGAANTIGSLFKADGSGTAALAANVYSLSSFLLVMDATGTIWNSDAANPYWIDGLSFLQGFSTTATSPVVLASHAGYLIAFSTDEARLFALTGVSPGSVLAPILSAAQQLGASNQLLSFEGESTYVFVGAPDTSGVPVFALFPNSLVPQRISEGEIEYLLGQATLERVVVFRSRGHLLAAILTLAATAYVYDFTTKTWYQWTFTAAPYVATAFNDSFYAVRVDLSSNTLYVIRDAPAGLDSIINNGVISSFAYVPTAVTPVVDGGTLYDKQWRRAMLVGDRTATSQPCTLSYSDDSNVTFSSSRTIDMSARYPVAQNLGTGRRRSFKVTWPASWSVALESLELHVEAYG